MRRDSVNVSRVFTEGSRVLNKLDYRFGRFGSAPTCSGGFFRLAPLLDAVEESETSGPEYFWRDRCTWEETEFDPLTKPTDRRDD